MADVHHRKVDAALVKPLFNLHEALSAFGRAHPEIRRIQLFGSGAKGEYRPDSDVDVVVSFVEGNCPRGMAGFTFLDDLKKELSLRLDRPVNLIKSGAMRTRAASGTERNPPP